MKNLFKNFLLAFGLVLILFGVLSACFANINAGNFVLAAAGIVSGSFRFLPSNKFTHIYTGIVIAAAAFFLIVTAVIITFGPDTADGSEDAVIVLGCAVIGDRPSNTMYARTTAAVQYYKKNPNAVFVLSGGRGAQETISEAEAMKRLMLAGGIPENRLIIEDKATSTSENYIYSKKLLDSYFNGRPYTAAYVTNDFHCYRAGRLAYINGFTDIRCIPAPTPKGAVLLCYAREVLAVIKLWIFKS